MTLRTLLPTVAILALWALWPQAQMQITPGQFFNFNGGFPTLNNAGTDYVSFPPGTGEIFASNRSLCWSTTTQSTGAAGTCIGRVSDSIITFATTPVLFANLLTPANGAYAYCSDCTIANPCAGGGTGAFAKRLNGVWVCN